VPKWGKFAIINSAIISSALINSLKAYYNNAKIKVKNENNYWCVIYYASLKITLSGLESNASF